MPPAILIDLVYTDIAGKHIINDYYGTDDDPPPEYLLLIKIL